MKTANLQSIKARNADTITAFHKQVKEARKHAKTHFQAAQKELKFARKLSATIKKLAAEQVVLKQTIKGPPKAKKPAKPDTRPLALDTGDDTLAASTRNQWQVIETPFGERLGA